MKPAESSVLEFIQFSDTRAAASLFICQNVLSEWASQKSPRRWRQHPPGHFFPPPFGTLNSWIIRSRIWVSSIYVNLKIGVSNVKHGLFWDLQICIYSFFSFSFYSSCADRANASATCCKNWHRQSTPRHTTLKTNKIHPSS